ncbi:MAG: polymer-forming cytoskeletal protein [Spirochaetes bacterium]|nr:polymer-forming cytoskeletal protein [Spirochaetota bacterium]
MARKIIQVNKNPVYEIGMIATVFGKETQFFGELTFKKSLQINGTFEGEISSGGFLVIGEGAVVKANINAKVVIVNGTVYGNIEAKEKLEIQPSGRVYGNIRTAKLKIADGVIFEGSCEMIKPYEEISGKVSAPKTEAVSQVN